MELRRERGGNRAQLIIITALVLATVFVALALVLNSGIYAENLSTRETTDSDAAIGYTVEAEAAVADAYSNANSANESTVTAAETAFTDVVDGWADARSRYAAENGVSAGFDRTPHLGWHLRQDENRSFTPASDSTSERWQVAHDAESVGTFRMNVSRDDLYDADADFDDTDDDAFHLNVTDGTDTWLLYVFQNASEDEMLVHQGDPTNDDDLDALRSNTSHTCHATTDSAVIDFQAATFGGTGCPPLDFSDNLSGPVDIYYENPHNSSGDEQINGTYELVLNGSTAIETDTNDEPATFNISGQATPTAQAVVYSASYSTVYERSDVRYSQRNRYAVREETYAG